MNQLPVRLSKTEKAEIEKSLAEFKHEQAVLLRCIRRHGNSLMATQIDRIFSHRGAGGVYVFSLHTLPDGSTIRIRKPPRYLVRSLDFMSLGSATQGEWAQWLHLLQLMAACGKVKITTRKGEIVYLAARKTSKRGELRVGETVVLKTPKRAKEGE